MIERVLFFGSRDYRNRTFVSQRVALLDPEKTILIAGGADGADTFAASAARFRGVHVAEVHALWASYKARSGHVRNAMMMALQPHRAEGFFADPREPSSGSLGTARLCFGANIPLLMWGQDGSAYPEILNLRKEVAR